MQVTIERSLLDLSWRGIWMNVQCLVVVQLRVLILFISEGARGSEASPLLMLE